MMCSLLCLTHLEQVIQTSDQLADWIDGGGNYHDNVGEHTRLLWINSQYEPCSSSIFLAALGWTGLSGAGGSFYKSTYLNHT